MAKETVPEGLASKAPSFDENTPLTRVIGPVLENSAVILTRDGNYSGIVDSYAVYRHLQNFKLGKKDSAAKLSARVPMIISSTEISDATYYFYKNRTRALPYSKNGKIIGLLTRTTLIKVLLSKGLLSGPSVEDAMSYPLIGIGANATVTQAKTVMREHKVDRLAVFQGNDFVGVITSYDMVDRMVHVLERLPEMKSTSYSPSNIAVSSIALSNPFTIDCRKPLADSARLMIENNVSSIIATKQGKPVGIITEIDLITSVMAASTDKSDRIYISGLDSATYVYEDEIKEELKALLAKMERMKNARADYLSVVVKKFKSNSYEINARISFAKKASFNVHATGHIFERTMSDALGTLEKEVRRAKEKNLTIRKIISRQRGDVDEEQ
jgi:CBS domain-containing protein